MKCFEGHIFLQNLVHLRTFHTWEQLLENSYLPKTADAMYYSQDPSKISKVTCK